MPDLSTGRLPPNFTLQQGRYLILRAVGQGGMAAVYRAADQRLGGKTVAIKEMSDAAITGQHAKQQAIDAFRQEAQMLARLDHPNLPKVTDFFSENGKHYIVMEFVEGETLETALRHQQVDEAQVRTWTAQLCDVLSYLHRQYPPVVFRDLKPANIMLTPAGQIKLIDFGIARFFKAGQAGDTVAMGTPGYAAPEQHGIDQTDARSDVYSLGVVLHQLLTSYDPTRTPFVLPPVRQLNPQVSPQMQQVILKATQIDKLQRFQSVEDLCRALGSTAVMAPVSGRARPLWPIVVAGIAILILLCGSAYLFFNRYQAMTVPGASPTAAVAIAIGSTATQPLTPTPSSTEKPAQPPTPSSTDTPLPTTDLPPALVPTVDLVALPPLPTIDLPVPLVPAVAMPDLPSFPTIAMPDIPLFPTIAMPDLPLFPTIDLPVLLAPTSTELASATLILAPTGTPTASPTPPLPGLGQGKIAFVSERDGNPEVYSMAGDGSGQTRLTRSGADDWSPSWSPDGGRLAFTSSRNATVSGMHNIYVMNADGRGVTRLTFNQAWDEFPAWSANGRSLAFVTTADGNSEIFAVDADGSNYRRLTFNGADDRAPNWSPDGRKIVFSSRRAGSWQIHVMDADGNNQVQLTFGGANDQEPVWSPDGRRIAFFSDRDGNAEIYVMDASGGSQTRLTFDPGRDEHPAWSPDGSAIAFWSNRGGRNNDVYVMWADGSQPTRFTDNPAPDGAPDWTR